MLVHHSKEVGWIPLGKMFGFIKQFKHAIIPTKPMSDTISDISTNCCTPQKPSTTVEASLSLSYKYSCRPTYLTKVDI